MYTYAEIERILAKLHSAEGEKQAGAFRARLKHLKRLGIPLGANPGKGKRIEYTCEHLYQLVFCLECAQFGFDPVWTVQIVETIWPTISDLVFARAEKHDDSGEDDLMMYFTPEFMTFAWVQSDDGGRSLIVPNLGSLPQSQLPKKIATMGRDNRRMCLLNVSEVLRMVAMIERDLGIALRP